MRPDKESRVELDHVFLAVSRGGPEAERLGAAGFLEGPPNTHTGQGTACRRFFFENGYLELIWLEDLAEATSPIVAPTALAARTGGRRGASRIGIGLRLREASQAPPVTTWPYTPPYLPAGVAIPMAASSSIQHEPLLFFLPRTVRRREGHDPHANGARRMTSVRLTVADGRGFSPELDWLSASGCLHVACADHESISIELDDGAQHETFVLRTPTPLTLRW